MDDTPRPLEFDATRAVVATPGIIGTGLNDEYVMLDPGPGLYYGLNTVGAVVWLLIQQPRSLGEIRERVCAEFDVTPDRCGEDLLRLVADLVARGLARYVDASDARR
jgi:hypothetical protein